MRSLLLVCLLSLSCLALAEDADAPGRVARLSLIEGDVSLAPAGTEEWAEALVNRPLTSGDRLFVDKGGRAELQVGSARIHLAEGTGLSVIDLDDDVMRLELSEGMAVVRVLRRRDGETIAIESPNASVDLLHPGEYRIEASPAGDRTIVAARSGGSEVRAEGQTWRVDDGDEGTFTGTGEVSANIVALGPRTAFEDWANDRNRISEAPVSSRYVSNEVIGYEDLERHGSWVSEPSYGHVWYPSYVAAGWAPYRFGRWAWVSPWGWSWVDNSPWGFAPFHYGRWAYVRSRWCWVPGPRHIRPVYAPALVAWTGSPGFNVAVGVGPGVGWFPLGPREVYVPGYRYSRRYLNNVNVSNTVIVNNTYITNVYNGRHRNWDYRYGREPHAVTVVDRDRFRDGRNLDGHWNRVDQGDLRRWHHDPRPPALAPNRDSVFAARTLGRIPGSADRVVRETFAQQDRDQRANDHRRPSRMRFDAEQRAIEANGGRPISRQQLRSAAANNLAAPGRLQTRPEGDGPREQQWREHRERAGQAPSADRDAARAAREAAFDSRDRARTSGDRPAWSRRENPESPVVNSLQQSDGNAASRSTERSREQPRPWRGNDWQDRARDMAQQNEARNQLRESNRRQWQSESPRQRIEQPRVQQQQPRAEQPRFQPRVEQTRPQPQPRAEQPRAEQRNFNRSNEQRSPRSGNNEGLGRGRSDSSNRSNPRYHQP